eukprot:CAMPEP_0168468016 /NCGR_PEP_ID=MMETSP0228-20121227/57486_1 /TAXON_ID=133427 /ORGANISM="Protoceratium reticulatum, Strain CCCM 535 (=CCMP 1889)" /LENGTH=152 /DNA_ID=CAMNT_0008483755 /DNA_START=97 /DNA_END=551 /DNA_ORIENTATION=-
MASMLQYRAMVEHAIGRQDLDVLAYDWLGCGASARPRDGAAYATPALLADLEAAYRRLLGPEGDSSQVPTVFVGHSFGTSLVTQLSADLHNAAAASAPGLRPPAALFLLAASDGAGTRGKTAIFHLPEFALDRLQPALTAGFVKMALHPDAG